MKKGILSIFLLVVFLYGCSLNDSDTITVPSWAQGKWLIEIGSIKVKMAVITSTQYIAYTTFGNDEENNPFVSEYLRMNCISVTNDLILFEGDYKIKKLDSPNSISLGIWGLYWLTLYKDIDNPYICDDCGKNSCICKDFYDELLLEYRFINKGTAYSVSLGKANEPTISFPIEFNGLPVTRIVKSNNPSFYDHITNIIIPDSITVIGHDAFAEASRIKDIIIGKNVITIGQNVFGWKVETITISPSVIYICVPMLHVNNDVFKSIHIDVNNQYYFSENDVLYDRLKSKIYVVPKNITNFIIPDSVITIGRYAFNNCENLTSIIIPDSVVTIGWGAFLNCSSLKNITIGRNVAEIEEYAFYYGTIDKVIVLALIPPSLGGREVFWFGNIRRIEVPASSLNAYKLAWSIINYSDPLKNIIFPIEE